jgi:hypothetical protein
VEACSKPGDAAHGLCDKHYARLLRHGPTEPHPR